MNLNINQIDQFYDTLTNDRNEILKEFKSNNIDLRTYKELNTKMNLINNIQLNLLKLRRCLVPDMN